MKVPPHDHLRQALNLIFAFAPIVVTLLGYVTGSNSNFDRNTPAEPYIVPAGYAFIIWAFIYGGSFAYGIYQALPRHRKNPLLRRMGTRVASTA